MPIIKQAPLQVPRMGFLPIIPVFKAGAAAWTADQVYAIRRDIVNDQKVQRSWEERNYIDILRHTVPHIPFWGDVIRGGRAFHLMIPKGYGYGQQTRSVQFMEKR
ncbi:hypothetical protein [Candidatus Cardinium hertigii]|uniref:hypothetical protein n=1 Tax=Candidatus Cardinium hertigii TaxID=247481 RepID=UPI001FA94550|nr:hypothetical protein [Candidatus Cardinium hertigii]